MSLSSISPLARRRHARAWSCVLMAALAAAAPSALCAESFKSPSSERNAREAAARAAGFDEAIAASKAGRFGQAEAILARDIRHQPNTLEWNLELARKLTHVAFSVRQRGAVDVSQALAYQALVKLSEIKPREFTEAPAQRQALVWQAAGLVHEQLLFDPTEAKAAYTRALQANPAATQAKAALDRLAAEEARRNNPTKG